MYIIGYIRSLVRIERRDLKCAQALGVNMYYTYLFDYPRLLMFCCIRVYIHVILQAIFFLLKYLLPAGKCQLYPLVCIQIDLNRFYVF